MNQYTRFYLSKLAEELSPPDQDVLYPAKTPFEQRENTRINEQTKSETEKNKFDKEMIHHATMGLSQPDLAANYRDAKGPFGLTRTGSVGKHIPSIVHNLIGTPSRRATQEFNVPYDRVKSMSTENKKLLAERLQSANSLRQSIVNKYPDGTYADLKVNGDVLKAINEEKNAPKFRTTKPVRPQQLPSALDFDSNTTLYPQRSSRAAITPYSSDPYSSEISNPTQPFISNTSVPQKILGSSSTP